MYSSSVSETWCAIDASFTGIVTEWPLTGWMGRRMPSGAGQPRADVSQRGLDAHRLVGRDHPPVAARLSQLCGSRLGAVEFLPPGVDVQHALGALDLGDAGVASARAAATARC